MLDYVVPYVKEREAFGEPIAHRQAVAFMCANIAIELDGLRLITWRGAARAEQGLPFAREAALAKRLGTDKGMQIGLDGVQLLGGHGYTKEHPVERWYRDLRAHRRRRGRRRSLASYPTVASLRRAESPVMAINLEMPKKLQAVIDKGHQGAAEMLRPISRKYDLAEHAYPVELDTLADLFEGISEAKTISFAGAEAFRDAKRRTENHNGGNMSARAQCD